MRKYLLLLLASVFCLQLSAQLYSDSTGQKKKKKMDHFLYGTVGFQLSGINGDSDSYNEMLPGFHFGLGIRLAELSDVVGLRTELTYSSQGSRYDDYVKGKVILSYLTLPVLIRAGSKSGFYGEGGIQPGLLLSAKDKWEDQSYDFKEYVNSFDFSVLLGAGYQKNRLGVGLRIAPGLSNINKDSDSKDRNFVGSIRTTFTF